MQINLPLILNEQGPRRANEDFVFPKSPRTADRVFLVCDGVGGNKYGQVASEILGQSMGDALGKNSTSYFSKQQVIEALRYAEDAMYSYTRSNRDAFDMASTFAMMGIGTDKVSIAWVGDSRCYHFRDGELLFRSTDHTLIQAMKESGMMSDKSAERSPLKNVLLKAVRGADHPVQLDFVEIEEPRTGDYLLLTSDGIDDAIDERELSALFSGAYSDDEIKQQIKDRCEARTGDNYSMVLVRISA